MVAQRELLQQSLKDSETNCDIQLLKGGDGGGEHLYINTDL